MVPSGMMGRMACLLGAVVVLVCCCGQVLAEEDVREMACSDLEELRGRLLKQGADHWGDLVLTFDATVEAMEACGLKTNRLRTRMRSFKAKMERQSWWDAHSKLDKEDVERRYEALQRLANESV